MAQRAVLAVAQPVVLVQPAVPVQAAQLVVKPVAQLAVVTQAEQLVVPVAQLVALMQAVQLVQLAVLTQVVLTQAE